MSSPLDLSPIMVEPKDLAIGSHTSHDDSTERSPTESLGGVELPLETNDLSFSSPDSDDTLKPGPASGRGSHSPSSDISNNSSPQSDRTVVPSQGDCNEGHKSLSKLDPAAPISLPFANLLSRQGQDTSWTMASRSRSSSSADNFDFMSTRSHVSSGSSEGFHSCTFSTSENYDRKEKCTDSGYNQVLLIPSSTTHHHRRSSSRLSSLPSIPSPLGPSTVPTDLGSDVSGLVPSPSTPNMRQTPNTPNRMSVAEQKDHGPSIKSSHIRGSTDPFIDRSAPQAASPGFAQRRAQAEKTIGASQVQDFQTFQHDRNTGSRVDLPIPPPPLPIVRGRLKHSRAARKKLDDQKVEREAWIITEAKKIADLNRAKVAAEQNYRQTGSPHDKEAWKQAIRAFNDATNLDKRQEERRNLFLPGTALRTGPENLPTDGFGGSASVNMLGPDASGLEGGQGRLMGYRMAFMERLGAEVAMKDEKEESAAEKLAKMSEAEKEEKRREIRARIEAATGRRVEKKAAESMNK